MVQYLCTYVFFTVEIRRQLLNIGFVVFQVNNVYYLSRSSAKTSITLPSLLIFFPEAVTTSTP